MRFKNEQVKQLWNGWVMRHENDSNPIDRGAVKFGKRFIELAESKLDGGGSLDCWRELVWQADEDMGADGISQRAIEIVLDYVVQAWEHGDELKQAMSG